MLKARPFDHNLVQKELLPYRTSLGSIPLGTSNGSGPMTESMRELLNPSNSTGSENSAHVTNSLLSEIEACKGHFNEHLPKDANNNL